MSDTDNAQAAAPKKSNQEQVVELLQTFLERAKSGQLTNVAIAFTTREGAADVFSSPMSPVSMCHLSKLFERRVNASYDRVLRATETKTASPTGAMRTNSPGQGKPHVAQLPRKVRRVVEKAQKKVAQQARKSAAQRQASVDLVAAEPAGKPQ